MGSRSKGGGSSAAADQARQDELERQARIRSGTAAIDGVFGQFDDGFFDARRQAYVDYATPQLQQQYEDAQRQLTYALARSGTLDSSVRANKTGELQRLFDLNRQQISDQAIAHQTEARNAVEGARGDLISTLTATGDAQGASNSALARANALSQPAAYSPLGQMFGAFTDGLGSAAEVARTRALMQSMQPTGGDTGLFSPRRNAVQVT